MTESTDILIIGAGPAGCSAAVYGARAGLKVTLLGGDAPGGQLTKTSEIDNYLGFESAGGFDIVQKFHTHAGKFGIEIKRETVVSVEGESSPFTVKTSEGGEYNALSVIITAGAKPRTLGLDSEKTFLGKGFTTCATCDGFFYKGKDVAVIGGGNTALHDALFLTKFCNKVYLVHRRNAFRGEKILSDKIKANPKIELVLGYTLQEILGDEHGINKILVKHAHGHDVKELPVKAVFMAIGTDPLTDFLKTSAVRLTEEGYVHVTHLQETGVPGIFAAGDCVNKHFKQAIIAAGDGARAAMGAINFVNMNK